MCSECAVIAVQLHVQEFSFAHTLRITVALRVGRTLNAVGVIPTLQKAYI